MGILYVVATPIGNLSDISKRALETLKSVDIIACEDTRTSSVLLKHFDINKKLVSYHKFNEKEKSNSLITDLINGKNIALISDAGCPCISDPGYILVSAAVKHNISVVAIPGPSAVIASLMVSGMDTESFSFYGFLSREKKKMEAELENIQNDVTKLVVLYESPKRIIKTLEIIDEVLDNPKICLCNELTKKFEKKYYGRVKEVLDLLSKSDKRELGEYALVIEKDKKEVQEEGVLAIEALLVDTLIKNNCTMKEAVKLVSEKYSLSKNDVYDASLNLKKLF